MGRFAFRHALPLSIYQALRSAVMKTRLMHQGSTRPSITSPSIWQALASDAGVDDLRRTPFSSGADETGEGCAVAIRLEHRWVSPSLSAHSLQEAANATLKGHRTPLMELPPPRAMPLGGTSRRRVGAFMRRGCWGGQRRPSDPLSRSSTSGADKLPHRFVNSVPASAQPCESNLLAREVATGRAAPSFCELSVDGQIAHGVTSSCRWGAPPLSYPRQWPRR